MAYFTNERAVKAVRKARVCDGCLTRVEVGDPAVTWAGDTGDGFGTATWHPECRAAEVALNRLHDTNWHDEWQSLQDLESEDLPWLIDEHPVVATRMGVAA